MVNKNNVYFPLSISSAGGGNYIKTSEKGSPNGVATLNSNGKLISSQLDTSTDDYKIKLLNLSEEVQAAMAGTAPVISSVEDGSLTSEKYADNSLCYEKLSQDLKTLYVKTKNLIDQALIDEGHYYDNQGSKGANANFSCVSGIEVIEGNTYTLYDFGSPYSFGARGVFRDSNDAVVGTVPAIQKTVNTFVVPENAVSCDINFWTTAKEAVCLVEGSIPEIDTKFNETQVICADNSVGYNKLDDGMNKLFINNPNLIDINKCQDGYRYISSNGSILPSNDFTSVTDIIVDEGETYTVTGLGTYGIANYHTIGCFYDTQGAFISALAQTTETTHSFTVPTGAKTMNINFDITAKDTAIMVKGTNTNVGVDFSDDSIKINSMNFLADGNVINLYNESDTDFINNGYYNANGELVSSSFFDCTGFIEVTPGKCYTSTDTTLPITWWDSNKTFLSGVTGANYNNKGFVIAPNNAAYIRVTFPNTGDVSLLPRQVVESSICPKYKDYDDSLVKFPSLLIGEDNMEYGSWKGKKWVSYGDSITARESWQPRVAEILKLEHTNLGIGGSSVCGTGAEAYKCFWDSDRIEDIKTADPDVITILGGSNDLYLGKTLGTDEEFTKSLDSKDKSNFKGAYSYLIESLLAWKKTLRIFILTTSYGEQGYGSNSTTNLTWRDFSNASREVAEYYGLPIVDLGKELGLNAITRGTYLSDYLHPKGYGGLRIAELVIGKLREIRSI